jgi:hypothetical protein
MANVCDKFRQNFKQTFIDHFAMMFGNLSTDKWFLSIGKPLPWLSTSGEIDNLPPAAADTDQTESEFWQNVLAHKRITEDDVSIVVPRYDWTIGTVYSPYRPTIELFNPDNPYIFYVLVDEERVYKCIDNNYGAPSTVAPTHTDTDVKLLSDGYRWKFMYSITESRRKFLLKGGLKTSGTLRPGYMPVENIESLGINDERYLQFAVQNAGVDGEVVFIYFLPEYSNYLISDRCIFSSTDNVIVSPSVSVGGLTATLYSPSFVPVQDYYNNMVLSIDSGQGKGQRRIISSYTPGTTSANVIIEVTNPFTVELLPNSSTFSIVPNVILDGDGSANNNTLDPLRTIADVSVLFDSTTITGGYRYVDSFEMLDTGMDYSYANLKVIAGLTFASNIPSSLLTDLSNVATPIISPQGGHGSNPVAELGGNSLMIVKKYSGNENGKVTSQNEFRQFGIIKNPDLAQPQVRVSTVQAGNANSFTVGSIVEQGVTGGFAGATGTVVSWRPGLTGYTGTSELILTNVIGNFTSGKGVAIGSTLDVFDIASRTRAGTDGRDLLVLTVTPTIATTFSAIANEFPQGMNAVGVGNAALDIEFSGSNGRIYRWDAISGLNNQGKIYLENAHGTFDIGETVGVRDRYMNFYSGLTGIAKIVEKTTVIEGIPDTYSQVYKFVLNPAGGDTFTSSSFVLDNTVYLYSGLSQIATGKVINWNTSGATGDLSVIITVGSVVVGNTISYTNASGIAASALVSAISQSPDFKFRSGQVQYIQNIRPVVRSDSQEEEIKLIIGL